MNSKSGEGPPPRRAEGRPPRPPFTRESVRSRARAGARPSAGMGCYRPRGGRHGRPLLVNRYALGRARARAPRRASLTGHRSPTGSPGSPASVGAGCRSHIQRSSPPVGLSASNGQNSCAAKEVPADRSRGTARGKTHSSMSPRAAARALRGSSRSGRAHGRPSLQRPEGGTGQDRFAGSLPGRPAVRGQRAQLDHRAPAK